MSCDKVLKNKVMELALGGLPPDEALEAERHVAGCPSCSGLRLAILEERAALRAAGAPLLPAGAGLTAAVLSAAAAYDARRGRVAAVALAFAAGLAALLLFVPAGRPADGRPPVSSINPFYAGNLAGGDTTAGAVIGELKGRSSELLLELSCRGLYAAGENSAVERKTGKEEI